MNNAAVPPVGPITIRTSGMNEARKTESENHPNASSRALAVSWDLNAIHLRPPSSKRNVSRADLVN